MGYAAKTEQDAGITRVRILADGGELAASGFGAETHNAFVYDRIGPRPRIAAGDWGAR